MNRRFIALLGALLLAALPLEAWGQPVGPPDSAGSRQPVIVVLDRGQNPRAVARGLGVAPTFVYENVINGFAAELPARAIDALRRNPVVQVVSPDREVEAAQRRRSTQRTPTGVNRIDADRNPDAAIARDGGTVDADVAVLDTGIAAHPELNIVGGRSCVGDDPEAYGDRNGHGTHVAGTIGAADNRAGVVGVAPKVRLWAVKVLKDNGSGNYRNVICGLDYVAANSDQIDVVNMSLVAEDLTANTGTCANHPFHGAVCNAVAAGVTVVVAAGNDTANAANYAPAAYDEAITVSSFTDYNGQPGGRAAATCYDDNGNRRPGSGDDTFSSFSNFGADVDIVAPGGCIRSTAPGRQYGVRSGTSMATPHVVGAAALYVARNPASTPADVRAYLLGEASRPQLDPEVGLEQDDDRDAFAEPILYLGPPPEPDVPLEAATSPGDGAAGPADE